jgi:small subunit ribosomal protein S20
MPITKSAKKALRVQHRKTEVNRRRKAFLKSAVKSVSLETLAKTFSAIDKAAKWGVIEKNKAARLKSRLSRQIGASGPARNSKPAAAPAKTKKSATKVAKKPTTKSAKK